jgi:hypothetical protein
MKAKAEDIIVAYIDPLLPAVTYVTNCRKCSVAFMWGFEADKMVGFIDRACDCPEPDMREHLMEHPRVKL